MCLLRREYRALKAQLFKQAKRQGLACPLASGTREVYQLKALDLYSVMTMLPVLNVHPLRVHMAFTGSRPAQTSSIPARVHCRRTRAQASTVALEERLHSLDSAKSALVASAKKGRASLNLQRRGIMEEAQVTPEQFCAHAVLSVYRHILAIYVAKHRGMLNEA